MRVERVEVAARLDRGYPHVTHTRPQTQRQQIEQALRRWPESLRYALERARQQ